jgi:hypothetical protein
LYHPDRRRSTVRLAGAHPAAAQFEVFESEAAYDTLGGQIVGDAEAADRQ